MEKKHVIQLQGQEFVTYEGLLNEAHQRGLKEIRTQLIQRPGPENGHTAIVAAEVTLDGDRVFTGLGDANPGNTSAAIARHAIRMAETRAKARALRDAVNVGMTAIEELGEATDPVARGGHEGGQVLAAAPTKMATQKQIHKVATEMARVGWTEKEGRDFLIRSFNKLSRSELTTTEISQLIDHLVGLPAKDDVG
jgi:hypothetical protein